MDATPSDTTAKKIRRPSQQRSRERQDLILGIAASRIAECGSDALRMSEIASLADISIGSLYQYFPDKGAIIRTLAERYNAESRVCIEGALATVTDPASLSEAYLGLIDQYYAIVIAEPVMRDIWSGTQADKSLMVLELEEARRSGELLARAVARAHGTAVNDRISTTSLLVWHLGEAAVRLAVSLDRQAGDEMIETFKRMSVRELLQPDGDSPGLWPETRTSI